ncbi:MAG: hypothetical protein K9W42_09300 [Candidatus Heimdallarchaeota archaeon]|nr:hypothetical protein [Candidatus Heimdallarchaeota archaeon]
MPDETTNDTSNATLEPEVPEAEKEKSMLPKWADLEFVPNKKRFIILTIVFSVLQIAGILAFTYGFLNRYEQGLFDFGIFIFAPFTGLAISYLVENKKEAVGVSAIVGAIAIISSLVVYIIVEVTLGIPQPFEFNVYTVIAIPIVFYLLEIALTYTLARIRGIYRRIGDSSIPRESDEALIAELRKSRIERGLEEPPIEEAATEETEEESLSSVEKLQEE